MKKIHVRMACLVLALGVIFGLQQVALGEAQGQPEFVPGEVLVKFKPGVGEQAIASIKANLNLETIKVFKRSHIYHLRILSKLSVQEVIARLRQSPAVEYAEPNYIRYLNLTPNDPRYPEMWGLNNTGQTGGTPDADIDAPEAWAIETGSPSMVVADIDSGMDLTHEDLAANLWTNPGEIPGNGIDDDGNGFIDDVHGWDFRNNDNDPTDTSPLCSGHGTHTAGTIGAVGNNEIGVTGINWQVKIMPLRVFGGILCSGQDANIIAAIEYYSDFGVRISNNSYGGGAFNQAVMDAIRASHSLFVAAAGNGGLDGIGDNNDVTPQYPASYALDNIISVAATDHNDFLASFSNFGLQSVDLGAPGVNILSTLPGSAYGFLSGTSMATPHVTGVAALLLAHDGGLTNLELKWRLLKGTDNIGLPVLTRGRLNAEKALLLESAVTVDVVPLGPTTIHPGDSVPYQVTVTNAGSSPKTVNEIVLVRFPDGTERTLVDLTSLTIDAGQSLTQNFTQPVPSGISPMFFGLERLVGRVWTAGYGDFDEDEALYTLEASMAAQTGAGTQ